jgi:NhaP-type Na+/H+ or K+/H+ antiporter
MGWEITTVAITIVAFATVSGRLRGSAVTPAIVFTGVGFVLGTEGLGLIGAELDAGTVRTLAEVTLALVLFSDASALNTKALRRETGVPARLLSIGLPLTVVIGTLLSLGLFPRLGLFEAIVLAVLLAPTDAALGQTVVADKRLPSRLRQGLNVESGLNDGVCVPLLFAAVAFAELDEAPTFEGEIVTDLLKEVGIAIGVGALATCVVAFLITVSNRRGWLDDQWGQVVPLATAAIAYTATVELGGSGFIAAFVAGLLYRQLLGASNAHVTARLTEEVGGMLSAVTFFVFGASLIGTGIVDFDVSTVVYAVLSLTVVRMVPVAIALIGSGAAPATMAFAGWFGPRGLATIVFMLTIIEESNLAGSTRIVQVATATVLLSVVAHGVTAPWLTNRYVQWFSTSRERLVLESQDTPDPDAPIKRSLWHGADPSRR